jgi:hypothetical protein
LRAIPLLAFFFHVRRALVPDAAALPILEEPAASLHAPGDLGTPLKSKVSRRCRCGGRAMRPRTGFFSNGSRTSDPRWRIDCVLVVPNQSAMIVAWPSICSRFSHLRTQAKRLGTHNYPFLE